MNRFFAIWLVFLTSWISSASALAAAAASSAATLAGSSDVCAAPTIAGLKADDDGRQLVALSELCELLSNHESVPFRRRGGWCVGSNE